VKLLLPLLLIAFCGCYGIPFYKAKSTYPQHRGLIGEWQWQRQFKKEKTAQKAEEVQRRLENESSAEFQWRLEKERVEEIQRRLEKERAEEIPPF
jgi:hypothetical protein